MIDLNSGIKLEVSDFYGREKFEGVICSVVWFGKLFEMID